MSSDTEDLLRQRLVTLHPLKLEIEDESHLHVGHAGARSGGGHYRIVLVAEAFRGLNTLSRHRLVYDAVGTLMAGPVHALTILAQAPDEA